MGKITEGFTPSSSIMTYFCFFPRRRRPVLVHPCTWTIHYRPHFWGPMGASKYVACRMSCLDWIARPLQSPVWPRRSISTACTFYYESDRCRELSRAVVSVSATKAGSGAVGALWAMLSIVHRGHMHTCVVMLSPHRYSVLSVRTFTGCMCAYSVHGRTWTDMELQYRPCIEDVHVPTPYLVAHLHLHPLHVAATGRHSAHHFAACRALV